MSVSTTLLNKLREESHNVESEKRFYLQRANNLQEKIDHLNSLIQDIQDLISLKKEDV